MAISSDMYKFLLVDIGDSGRKSEGSVYANSHLGYAIETICWTFQQKLN